MYGGLSGYLLLVWFLRFCPLRLLWLLKVLVQCLLCCKEVGPHVQLSDSHVDHLADNQFTRRGSKSPSCLLGGPSYSVHGTAGNLGGGVLLWECCAQGFSVQQTRWCTALESQPTLADTCPAAAHRPACNRHKTTVIMLAYFCCRHANPQPPTRSQH